MDQHAFELYRKAEAANDMGRFESAQSLAAQAVASSPETAEGYGSLARACIGLAQLPEAKSHCLTGLEKQPDEPWLLRMLVIVTRLLEHYDESIRYAERLLELCPDHSDSHLVLGKTLAATKRFDDAIEHLNKALELNPGDDSAFSELGSCFLEKGKPKIAEQQYRQALSLKPNNPSDLNNLGVCLQRQGKLKDAALAFKAAVVADPDLAIAKRNVKTTINGYVYAGGGIFAVYLLAKVVYFFGKSPQYFGLSIDEDKKMLIGASLAWGVILSFLVFLYARRWMRKRALKNADPQILKLYKNVCKEKNLS